MLNRVRLFANPGVCQAPLSMEFSRQDYWSGLPFPTPGDLPDPGMEPLALCLLHWQADSLPLVSPGNSKFSSNPYFKKREKDRLN